MQNKQEISVFWHRRDLRLEDNAGLYHALRAGLPVLCLFILDKNILSKLESNQDHRVIFIHRTLHQIKSQLTDLGSDLMVQYGHPVLIWEQITKEFKVRAVYTNHDYDGYAQLRDYQVKGLLQNKNIPFHTYKDHVIFEKEEILTGAHKPYTVFTPYSKTWKAKCTPYFRRAYPTHKYFANFLQEKQKGIPTLKSMGFKEDNVSFPSTEIPEEIIQNYHETRDFPAMYGTSRMGIHVRFGTVSIRKLVQIAFESNETWLNELIWRDFYQQIIANFPQINEGKAFNKAYDRIPWRNHEGDFEKWCTGQTGYPLVDAGMRELNATGFMHNRARMITASFLTKHLLIDWRWGEAYFASKLLDFDFASNNGGWQWAAGSGTDAVPYFRIFNPTTQAIKFDGHAAYIKKWIPEFNTLNYPEPMIDHQFARERCLAVYKSALNP